MEPMGKEQVIATDINAIGTATRVSSERSAGEQVVVLCRDTRVRDLLSTWLRQAGLRARIAQDGRVAYQALESCSTVMRILITDRAFPPWPGLGSIIRLKQQVPRLRVILIQDTGIDEVAVAEAAGADVSLSRSLSRADLLRSLDFEDPDIEDSSVHHRPHWTRSGLLFPDIAGDDVFRLETKRLWLRWPRVSDAESIARLARNRTIAEMTTWVPCPSSDAEQFIFHTRASNAIGRGAGFLITTKDSPSETIGFIGLRESLCGDALLGYWIGVEYWGEGLATEAAQAIIDAAFMLTRVPIIGASVPVSNTASRKLLEECGFFSAGPALELRPAPGCKHPCEEYRLNRKVWEMQRSFTR
jgi:RimJ/RimL family protein N-acetyltransferase